MVHVCEKKRRFLARNEKHVKFGLLTFQKFWEITQNVKKPKTFEDFIQSQYYTAFVKFGSFMANAKPIHPERFIEYVVRSGIKIDRWCRDEVYDTYLAELIKIEPSEGAVQRSLTSMMNWADENNAEWQHYFKYASNNRLTHDIREGRVSPWIILNCKSGKRCFKELTDEQLEIIAPIIDPVFWMQRFKTLPADTALIESLVEETKIP